MRTKRERHFFFPSLLRFRSMRLASSELSDEISSCDEGAWEGGWRRRRYYADGLRKRLARSFFFFYVLPIARGKPRNLRARALSFVEFAEETSRSGAADISNLIAIPRDEV